MRGSQGNAKKFHLSDVRRLIRCRSNVELVGVLAVGENPSSCRGGSSPPNSCSAHLSFFFFYPKVHLEVLKFFHATGTPDVGRNPPPAKLTFKSKSYDLRNAEEKIFKLLLFGFALFPGLLLFIFFSISTVPPVEPVSERHPSLSHTYPNHHSPRLVGIPSTKRLHSKQKLGLEKLCKNLPFFWCCFWVCRHLTSMMKLFKIHRPPIEPISETHPPASTTHPPHLASPVGRKEETLPTKLLHSSQKLQLEKLKNEHFVFALFSSLPQFHFSDSIVRLPHRTHFCKASPS